MFKDTCAQCHRFGDAGNTFAPDLTRVAERLPRRDILRAIFFPNEKVDPNAPTTVLVTTAGATMRGLLVSENAQSVVVKTATDVEPVTVPQGADREALRREAVDHARRSCRRSPTTASATVAAYLMGGK